MKEAVKDGDVRIFPYYKGKYMGVDPLGFSNEKSAKAYMQHLPEKDVYAEFGGKEAFENTYMYSWKIDKSETVELFDKKKGMKVKCPGFYEQGKYVTKSEVDPELWNKAYDEYCKLVNECGKGFWMREENSQKCVDFERKYGLFPRMGSEGCRDDNYLNMEKKLRKNVEFRKGIVHINIEFI